MSELFDSLNLSNSAGPSSSQQSSSQPSTSKVFWHASPSPGVLRQLCNWTPSRSQDSPTLPLCTQAFVGELKKLPRVLEAQSPLISKDSAKRKLNDSSRRNNSASASKGKVREVITLDVSDDDDEDEGANAQESGPRQLLLGDAGESSPESRRRRTMDAGSTGRLRESVSPSKASYASKVGTENTSSHRRLDRRPPRRRKKESLMAGLGLTDGSGRPSDCLKLFEDLQAAIQGMNASKASLSGPAGAAELSNLRPCVTFDGRVTEGQRLTSREGINRTSSAPNASRMETVECSAELDTVQEEVVPRRVFRPVKSDHDVFKAASPATDQCGRALQPKQTNVLRGTPPQPDINPVKAHTGQVTIVRDARAQDNVASTKPRSVSPLGPKVHIAQPVAAVHEAQPVKTRTSNPVTPAKQTSASNSPIKRSARIEAMQHSSKKLGTRVPSTLSKSTTATASPRKTKLGTNSTSTSPRNIGGTAARTRTHPLPGMSQARQVGLPRSSSQFVPSPSQTVGPSAPFRPPAIAKQQHVVRSTSPAKATSKQAASSDDSFGDEDDAFLALACELEY